ncbi:MAG: hypothetical protein HIU86_06065 [Acidobacteria bacterium]|nr:hypothetical protein [Acidobacteriota bacterium]
MAVTADGAVIGSVSSGCVEDAALRDEGLDPLALAVALEGGAGFVGAIGPRSTARPSRAVGRSRRRCRGDRVAAEMPSGLDIGARAPAELAVAVLAEVLAVRNGLDAVPFSNGSGWIHRVIAAR